MTIIQPNKSNFKVKFLISILIIACLGMALWGLFIYNQSVNFRHELVNQKTALQKAEVSNAELKDKIYNIKDSDIFSSSTNSQSLILDKNPQYIKDGSLVANN